MSGKDIVADAKKLLSHGPEHGACLSVAQSGLTSEILKQMYLSLFDSHQIEEM